MNPFLLIGLAAAAAVVLGRKKATPRTARMGCPSPPFPPGEWHDYRDKFSAFGKWYGFAQCVSVSVEYAPRQSSVKPGEPFVLNLNFVMMDTDTVEVRYDQEVLKSKKITNTRIAVWVPADFRGNSMDKLLLSIWPESIAFSGIKFNMQGYPMVRVQPGPGDIRVP